MQEIIEIKINVQGTQQEAQEIAKNLQNIADKVNFKNIKVLGKAALKSDINKTIEKYKFML